ncbi:hypothetical protein [Alkalibacterium sp. AK22]|uniref:hypothetical protein n=1 Tax=Alkalibacterium sp. AK22 TaxID=1229520 RepID=UPI0005573F6A|nr:hypothetical protein [Alkalibacterium sp. AK22]
MRNEQILHNLTELERHTDKIITNLFASLGLVDNYSPNDEEVHKICKIEYELFKERILELKVEIKMDKENVGHTDEVND